MTNTETNTKWALNTALRSFQVHHNKSSFRCTMKAAILVWENQNRMLHLSRDVYEVVAPEQDIEASGVCSAIQRAAVKAWENNRKLLQAYNRSLDGPPTNYEFLEILIDFLEDPNRDQYINP